MTVADIAA